MKFENSIDKVLSVLYIQLFPLAASAKSVSEAMSVVTDSESSDPNGFKLMVISIGLLVFLAFSLIGVTIFYFSKNKKQNDK